MAADADEIAALRAGCTRFLTGHGKVTAMGMLATIPANTEVDTYGEGGVVAALEREIASYPNVRPLAEPGRENAACRAAADHDVVVIRHRVSSLPSDSRIAR